MHKRKIEVNTKQTIEETQKKEQIALVAKKKEGRERRGSLGPLWLHNDLGPLQQRAVQLRHRLLRIAGP